MDNFKRYKGTKIISARPMSAAAAISCDYKVNGATLADQGYEVEYKDGYRSWSPAGAFEEAYHPLPDVSKKIFVAVPAGDKKIYAPCVQSLMNAMQVMLLGEIPFEFKFEVGCPCVSTARNNLVRAFMQSDCTDLVFIDSDLGFTPQGFKDLIESDELVIGGAYPKKQEMPEFAVQLKTDADDHPINENGALVAISLATGFLKINRSVIERMQDAYSDLLYTDVVTGGDTYNLFGTYVEDGQYYMDDYGFCHLWEKIGGSMHLLSNLSFSHSGAKTYEGNFHEFLTKQSKYPAAVQKACKIEGFMTEQELEWLYHQASRMDSIIELGSWKGRSTTALLEGCKGLVTAVDNWTGHDPSSNGLLEDMAAQEDVFSVFRNNVSAYPNVRIRRGDTDAVDAPEADMVFIDAEHTYEGCKADIERWLPKARRMIAGHDYRPSFPGVVRAVTEAFGPVNVVGTIWYKELA